MTLTVYMGICRAVSSLVLFEVFSRHVQRLVKQKSRLCFRYAYMNDQVPSLTEFVRYCYERVRRPEKAPALAGGASGH
jgi:hypothetical protein